MNQQGLADTVVKGLLIAVVAILAGPDLALAQSSTGGANLNETATELTTQISTVPQFISALFWIGGAVLMGTGVLKLKDHSENPTQTPLRHGISRVAVGAALLTIPFFSQFAYNTLSAGNGVAVYTPLAAP